MRRYLLSAVAAGLVLVSAVVAANQDRAFWAVFLDTSVNRNAGMPDMSAMLRNMPPEALRNLPPEARAMMAGGAQRRFSTRVWSPGIAPREAKAEVFPPAGAKLGEKLTLALWRPGDTDEEAAGPGDPGAVQEPQGKFTIKIYWGSSRTVKPGQPKVVEIDWATLPEVDRARMRQAMEARDSLGHRADWTDASWPTAREDRAVEDDARMEGTIRLETNYTGSTSVEVPANVNFLAGIEFSQPDLAELPDLSEALEFKWDAIANCLGYQAQITGMIGRDTLILWYAGEAEPREQATDDFMQMADVRRLVEEQQFLPGDATAMTAPAGIFVDCDFVNLTMTGYGTGAANDEGQPRARVQSRTRFMGMLGGKMAQQMMPGAGGGRRRPRG